MTRRSCLRLERQLHGSAARGELELVFAGEPADGGHDQVGWGVDPFLDRGQSLAVAVGEQAPDLAGHFADVQMRSGRARRRWAWQALPRALLAFSPAGRWRTICRWQAGWVCGRWKRQLSWCSWSLARLNCRKLDGWNSVTVFGRASRHKLLIVNGLMPLRIALREAIWRLFSAP